jgi:nitrogen fixation protein FixH
VGYEKQLQREREAQSVEREVACAVTDDGRFIRLSLPATQGKVRGKLTLYRPSDSSLDREIKLEVDADGAQLISTDGLAKGRWRARVQWEAEGREFYKEFVLTIG